VCRAFAEYRVNIVACVSMPEQGHSLVRFVVDHVEMAKKALDNEGLSYRESAVASVRFLHRPGELALAAARLGDAEINIDYAYCGVDPNAYMPLIIFGVADAELRPRFWTEVLPPRRLVGGQVNGMVTGLTF
jgi:hypothetical protein